MNFTKNLISSSPTNYRDATVSKHRYNASRRRDHCRQLLAEADVEIDGMRPWDIHVHTNKFYSRVFSDGSLGLGEAYVDGWWDCEALDHFFFRVLSAGLESRVKNWKSIYHALKSRLFNLQKISRAHHIGQYHYDIGNELYSYMLDKRMIYSCGYWRNAETLEEAQEAKLALICRKLELEPGMRFLDIGCGWGGLAAYAAEKYGVSVVGITVSREQVAYARNYCKGLPVTIMLEDYRKVEGRFDRIASVGMFEHVGYKNYRIFMECLRKILTKDGLALLHTIGRNSSGVMVDRWISRYIFPNSMLPSVRQLSIAMEELFIVEDWHSFGTDYDTTLLHWFGNFDKNWESIRSEQYDERFYRLWKYYLLSCAGSFRARNVQLWQMVLAPLGRRKEYCAPR